MWKSTFRVLRLTVVLIYLALFAYFSVFLVSSKAVHAGLMLQIMTVLQFPPRESFNKRVNLESLKGMWAVDFCSPFYTSHKAFMQFPRANRLLFMFAPSMSLYPRLFVWEALSDPARSISDNFAMLISADVPWARSLCSTVTCKTAWDLLDASLASVLSFVLYMLPLWM